MGARRQEAGDKPRLHALSGALVMSGALAYAQSNTPALPNTGQDLSPLGTFAPLNPGIEDHPEWTATHAVSSVVNPTGNTMLVLNSGF
jgi:hypothetical protein